MAVHDDSNVQKKISSDALEEIPTLNVENMQNNTRIISYSRTFMSTIGLAAKTGFAVHSFFDSWNQIVFDGAF
ncbi:ER membrane protein complex subunit 6-like [Salvia divinorum]|uniref:ER membrane protein complex subunit 6-like n=1 Tax=Salvia divinorum TaxID=28513 RepID=A0ABD1GMH8_SALDI